MNRVNHPLDADAPADAAGMALRQAAPAALAQALRDSRRDTLATFAAFEAALPALAVPLRPTLNPPLWELGHVGWFQAWWLARNPERRRGAAADPHAPRRAQPQHDAWYNSSEVAHASRWALPLPDAETTRADLAAQLDETLALLADTPEDDTALYFFRLAVLHEDMHHEAAVYTAQALGVPLADARWQPRPLPAPRPALRFAAATFEIGQRGPGFAFDNELAAHSVAVAACAIDSQVRRWADVLPFIDAGGYDDSRWWSDAGRAWRLEQGRSHPCGLRRHSDGLGCGWEQQHFGRWIALDPALPACHLNRFEAEAWCAWAGRRLPSEAEWERAAIEAGTDFAWGEVWEWTASPFAPYPGFVAHPYRDYSQPWFDGRPVLRGASVATQPRLRHPRYRNFYGAGRNDMFAGFRSCAL